MRWAERTEGGVAPRRWGMRLPALPTFPFTQKTLLANDIWLQKRGFVFFKTAGAFFIFIFLILESLSCGLFHLLH